MNPELLDTLLVALQFSPENLVLRRQVVVGLVELERWQELTAVAAPLQRTEHHALACMALARAAHGLGDTPQAWTLYEEATTADATLMDEAFEELIAPEAAMVLPDFGDLSTVPPVLPSSAERITFADVGGMEELKEQIRMNILYPFQHPEMFAAYGKKVGGGILLYGPPGCGKTYLARATAGELGANFYPLELSDVLSMWIGESEKQLSALFETARANAPSVIFIDEVDALGAKRSDLSTSPIRLTITQLLTEMDGFGAKNSQVLVLGATNEPWNIDPAFRRPGRFDRVIFVPPPDGAARQEILRLHARGRKMDQKIPWQKTAEGTDLYSGADLAALVDRACEVALTEAMKTGNFREVTLQDFQKAQREMRPSTTEWLRRVKNYVAYANQDGLYDNLAAYLQAKKLR